MPLPECTERGDLPVGVHSASLVETISRFGIGSGHRKLLALRLGRIYDIALATGHLA
jgi:hypothetical protein